MAKDHAGEAEAAARRALSVHDTSENWAALGNCLYVQQRWDEACQAFREAIARDANDAGTWRNLGAAEHALERFDAAAVAYERSLALAPDDPNAATRYGLLLTQRGNIDRAIPMLVGVLAKWPQIGPAWLTLGNAERLRDRLPQAEAAYREAVRRAPGDRDARLSLAMVLLQQAKFCETEVGARQLVSDNPRDAEAWTALGGALNAQGRTDEAIEALRRSVELQPEPANHSKYLVALSYAEAATPEGLLNAHRQWDAMYARSVAPVAGVVGSGRGPGFLRLGFSGMDFSRGPTGCLALRALECLDKSQCSVAIYADGVWQDEHTERFRAAADTWRSTMGLTDAELAEQVRRDGIDVWFDLGGHVGRRLLAFARRPAPLQVTWLGYVGTTGLSTMDGLLADRFHIRDGEEGWYGEQILRMPNGYVCYGPPSEAPEVGPLPAAARGQFTFGCFNNPAKFSPSILSAWATILRQAPGSQLFLKYAGLEQPELQNRIRGQLVVHGVAAERIVFEGRSNNVELMGRYGLVDLALDTLPYSGGLTTCEALWMGVPVVTCPGKTFAGRHSTSHMTNAGYGQFVAEDVSSYVELACEWAGRLDELAAIRREMREKVSRSALCDGTGFARDLVVLLRQECAAKGAHR